MHYIKPSDSICNCYFFKITAKLVLLCTLLLLSLVGWNTDLLEIYDNSELLCSVQLKHGHILKTSYLHSVEKTQVEDEYRIANGKLWSWEECVRSSNAGMPSVLPKYMHFHTDRSGRLIFRGGRIAADTINLRSGNEIFGRNTICLAPFRIIPLYKKLPDRRLVLKVIHKPYIYQNIYFSNNIKPYKMQ